MRKTCAFALLWALFCPNFTTDLTERTGFMSLKCKFHI